MFTGIIEEVGTVESIEPREAGACLCVRCSKVLEDAREGASIAVNGVCLTMVASDTHMFEAELAPETLRRTNLGDLSAGSLVNLERPLRVGGRLDGHLVQGHVDGTAEFIGLDQLGADNWWLRVRVHEELERYLVFKGSVALDGVSLTIAELYENLLGIAIIPHTWHNTALRQHRPGSRVNVECDVFARYMDKWSSARSSAPGSKRP